MRSQEARPTMDPPNCVPPDLFFLQLDDGDKARFLLLGCRHGLMFIFHASMDRLLVWDPVTGYKHTFSVPEGFDGTNTPIHGAVVRSAQHFQVVMVDTVQEKQDAPVRASARIYSSETGIWGDLISIPLPPKISGDMIRLPAMLTVSIPGVLVEDCLYWLLTGCLLEFDLDRQRLAVMPVLVDMYAHGNCHFSVMRAHGGGPGFLFLPKLSAQLWKRKTDCDAAAASWSWVLERTIEMDKLLSLNSARERASLMILGFAEDSSVVFLWTTIGLFTVQLESLHFKKLFQTDIISSYHTFESVYTAGTSVGGGHDGAELLHNT